MIADDDQQAWRILKATTRARKHHQRLEQQAPEVVSSWLLAVDRDDASDDRAVAYTESPLEAR